MEPLLVDGVAAQASPQGAEDWAAEGWHRRAERPVAAPGSQEGTYSEGPQLVTEAAASASTPWVGG